MIDETARPPDSHVGAGCHHHRVTTSLRNRQISDAVSELGWRLVLSQLDTTVTVPSLAAGLGLATQVATALGRRADEGLRVTAQSDAVVLTLQSDAGSVTAAELESARVVSDVVTAAGYETRPVADPRRAVQAVEFAVDAMDIDAVRPFWRAVLGYVDAPDGGLYDPAHRGFPVWFQQMDRPRLQRNRIHFDVSVAHDEATARIAAALAAGGVLVSESRAPAFWIMADVEGNEVCVCTWQGRDEAESVF